MSYHNTTESRGAELERFEKEAQSQEQRVLEFFQGFSSLSFSPEAINFAVLPNAPITSVRRAITNLTHQGYLIKTSMQIRGKYGRPVFLWRLAE